MALPVLLACLLATPAHNNFPTVSAFVPKQVSLLHFHSLHPSLALLLNPFHNLRNPRRRPISKLRRSICRG
jgi:hypothetical protein